jgi:phytoene desaturase
MTTKPAVVIGSGFGGLAAAVRLRAKGYPVVVLEANGQPGGRASVFRRGGYSFDAGPTVITAPYLFDELFTALGRDPKDYYELMPVDPFYRILYHDGSQFDYVGDEARILDQIEKMSPRDVDGYRRLATHCKRIFDIGYLQLADRPFDTVYDMIRVIPDMMKLQNHRTVYSMVSRFIHDERLRQAFSFQPLLVGGNPFQTTSIYMLIHWLEREWGVWFPKGGTTSLVSALVRVLNETGVEVRLNAPVAEIEVVNGAATGVRLESGERIDASMVVSNADPSMTYSKMIPASARSRYTDRAIQRKKQSMSLVVGYFGTTKPYPDIAHHTIVLGPRYEGLLDDIFNRKVLADDFSLYLHAPTRSDPTLAPAGHEAFYVLSPVPNQRSGLNWAEIGQRYYDGILDHLEKRMLPGLKAHMDVNFHVDPRYFETQLRSYDGAAFGPEPILTQSAWFRYHNRSEDVRGLYFVGAGTHPGAGVPGVLCSAKVLDRVVPEAEGGGRIAVPPARKAAA